MKTNFSRELALLSLPVLLLGGFAWWKSRGADLPFEKFWPASDEKPLRLEFSPFQTASVTPFEVSRGYVWKTRTTVYDTGKVPTVNSWRRKFAVNLGNTYDIRIVYRRGQVWKQVEALPGRVQPVSVLFKDGGVDLLANLTTVPGDADAVHLRGRFAWSVVYGGQVIPGTALPPGTRKVGADYEVPVESEPFDIPIVDETELMPRPNVSRQPNIEMRGQRFNSMNRSDSKGNPHHQTTFFLHLHHLELGNWSPDSLLYIFNPQVFDANNREIPLYWDFGQGRKLSAGLQGGSGIFNQQQFSAAKPSSDLIVSALNLEIAPKKPWSSYKQPLRFELEVSDGNAWPTKIRAIYNLNEAPGALKDFGAPPQ
ncbi:hypothetical protein EON80_10210 [bacterium]|nr:MAG: hypothetical protein EON80_10210 [bacterium]